MEDGLLDFQLSVCLRRLREWHLPTVVLCGAYEWTSCLLSGGWLRVDLGCFRVGTQTPAVLGPGTGVAFVYCIGVPGTRLATRGHMNAIVGRWRGWERCEQFRVCEIFNKFENKAHQGNPNQVLH